MRKSEVKTKIVHGSLKCWPKWNIDWNHENQDLKEANYVGKVYVQMKLQARNLTKSAPPKLPVLKFKMKHPKIKILL